MNGGANRVEARKSEDGLATTQFRKIPRRLRRGASFIQHFLRIILLKNLTFVSDIVFTEKVFDSLADIQEQFTRTLVKIR
jgi:hypothetical protein